MTALWRASLVLLALLTVITGAIYPLAVTVAARAAFPREASGSLVHTGGAVAGSVLIGQPFTDARYFWGRASATGNAPYDASASGGTNLAPSNPALAAAVAARIAALREADPAAGAPPIDLVTASGSGLDPEISPAAAEYQVPRVARARGMAPDAVRALVARATHGRQWGVLGEARVNVLALNLALDAAGRPQ